MPAAQRTAHRSSCLMCVEIMKTTREKRLLKLNGKLGTMIRCGQIISKPLLSGHVATCKICLGKKRENIAKRQLEHNKSDSQRAVASLAAKKTSARPEIQVARAANLKKWRETHPEEFAKITQLAHKSAKKSKIEAWLRGSGTLTWPDAQIRCDDKQKQVDFVSENVWVEVDGFFHFSSSDPARMASPADLYNTSKIETPCLMRKLGNAEFRYID